MNQHLSDWRGVPVLIFLHFPLSPCAPSLAGHLSTLTTQYGVVLSHQQNRCQTRVFVHFLSLSSSFPSPRYGFKAQNGSWIMSLTLKQIIKNIYNRANTSMGEVWACLLKGKQHFKHKLPSKDQYQISVSSLFTVIRVAVDLWYNNRDL